jgi:hypothetical protein
VIWDFYYENGVRKYKSEIFKPVCYEHVSGGGDKLDIYGNQLIKIKHNSYRDYINYMYEKKKSLGDDWFPVGDVRLKTQYISKYYSHEIDYDIDIMRIYYFDIEVDSENGFPDPFLADKKILSIAVYDTKSKKYYVFGLKELTKKLSDNVIYGNPFSESTSISK